MADTSVRAPATTFGFMTVSSFKENTGIKSMQVLRSPKSNKLFVAADNGSNYNCQQDLDVTKPMSILVPDNDIAKACLINPSSSAEVLVTL